MISTIHRSIIGFAFMLMGSALFAQDCNYYHRKACDPPKSSKELSYDSQSRSATLAKGQISEFHMVAYDGLDYRISICAEEILGEGIEFRIYEKKRVLIKPADSGDDEVFKEDKMKTESIDSYADETYDEYGSNQAENADGYTDAYVDVYSEEPIQANSNANKPKFKLVKELLYDNTEDSLASSIEFSAEGSMSLILEVKVPGSPPKSKLSIRDSGCVGVLIEHGKSRNMGF